MKNIKILVLFVAFISCKENNEKAVSKSSIRVSLLRPNPSKKAVARYLIPMGDPKLGRTFGVEVLETPFTFKYLLSMQFDGMIQEDTLKLPELNSMPTVVVKPGPEKLSCVIGFLDDKKIFREYKLLSVKDNQLRLKVLRRYAME